MTDAEEKIIVFESYDNVIMANIVKTKLDAYGIPCFLTNENFTGLYPIRNDIFPGARLHIFEKDLASVQEILGEGKPVRPKEVFQCPRCLSRNVVFEESEKGYLGRLFVSVFRFLMAMNPLPRTKNYHCNDCGMEFNR
ncbi:MAG TPA: hypothetical protein VK517_01755 [Cyclobacteriaceae bacterium]|jgi:DNA-directed RNA polymerase subunit RPC12/RpoP|nr:hypothetical protein [Cyclobacteriaceae bacterium]